jgi:hypothetical protein
MKVREVITLKGWVEGSGWSYSQVYSDEVIEIDSAEINNMDWVWWEIDSDNPPTEDEDTKIIVEFYDEDAEPGYDEPIAKISKWASELYKERYPEDDED